MRHLRASATVTAVCIGTVALIALGATTAPAGRAPMADVEAVRQTFRLYTAAIAAIDIDTAKRYIIADEKRLPLIEGRRAAAVSEQQFQAAVDKAFPGAPKRTDYGPPVTRPADAPDPDHITVTKDTATLTSKDAPEPARLRRVDGAWKIDLNEMYTAETAGEIEVFRGALVEVMNALASEVAAGRFKTFAEVQAELETRVKMRIATPDLPATTRPAR